MINWLNILQEEFDIKKKFPDYVFNKWVFRSAVILVALFILFLGMSEGFNENVYLSCPLEQGFCENPLFGECDKFPELCTSEFLPAGFVVGEPPSWFVQNHLLIVFLVIGLSFLVNHVIFNIWKKNKAVKK